MKKLGKFITALLALVVVFTAFDKASASANEVTQDQKESYYEQYVTIIDEVNAKYGTELEISALEEFKSEEWVKPSEFKQIAIDMANLKFVAASNDSSVITPFSTTSKTKSVSTTIKGVAVKVSITGSFNTQLSNGRQLFGGINSLTSKADKGTWSQTSYTPNLIDGGRTYAIYVGGKFTYNGISDTTNVYVEFYCSSTGVVS